jgi:hypothetical protein
VPGLQWTAKLRQPSTRRTWSARTPDGSWVPRGTLGPTELASVARKNALDPAQWSSFWHGEEGQRNCGQRNCGQRNLTTRSYAVPTSDAVSVEHSDKRVPWTRDHARIVASDQVRSKESPSRIFPCPQFPCPTSRPVYVRGGTNSVGDCGSWSGMGSGTEKRSGLFSANHPQGRAGT